MLPPKRYPGQNVDPGSKNPILGSTKSSWGMKKQKMRAEKPCRTQSSEFQTEPYSASYGQQPFWRVPAKILKYLGGKSYSQKGKSCIKKGETCIQKGNTCIQKGKPCMQKGKSCIQKGESCMQEGKPCMHWLSMDGLQFLASYLHMFSDNLGTRLPGAVARFAQTQGLRKRTRAIAHQGE